MEDLIAAIIKKGQLDDETQAGSIRIYETHSHKFYKELTREHAVASITEFVQLIAERIPEEDLKAAQNEFIYAFHYQTEPSKPHGIPFKFHIKEVSSGLSIFLDKY